jgi:hypothetical protein
MKTVALALLLSACMSGQHSALTAESQGTIHGVLIGQDGKPAKKIALSARLMCPTESKPFRISQARAVTDQNGEFRFIRVGVGSYAVFADDPEAGYGYDNDPRYRGFAEITLEHPDAEVRLFLPPRQAS